MAILAHCKNVIDAVLSKEEYKHADWKNVVATTAFEGAIKRAVIDELKR